MSRPLALALLFVPLAVAQGLEGVVVSTVTGVGIPGVEVTVYTRQGVRYTTRTAETGSFRVTNLAEDSYEVRLEKENYLPGLRDIPQPYRMVTGQSPIRVRMEMTKQVSIRGRVFGPSGEWAGGVQVLLDNRTSPGALTDNEGSFEVTGVPPGFHTLLAVAPPVTNTITKSERERVQPIPTYFPSAIEPTEAQRIVVGNDTDVTGIDISVRIAAVQRVRGIVLTETAAPMSGVVVRMHPMIRQSLRVVSMLNGKILTLLAPGSGYGPAEASFTTGSDGTFEFPSVRSGQWQIAATYTGNIDSPDFAKTIRTGSMITFVGNGDLDDLQLRIGAPFSLSGTAEWSGLASRQSTVMLINANGSGAMSLFEPGPPGPAGRFTLGVRPGRYYLMPTVDAGYYPVSMTLDGRDALGQPFDFLGGSPEVKVVYRPAQGIVRGKVDPGTAFVILIPDRITSMGFGRMERPKPDGTYEASGMPPGGYFAAAFSGPDLREQPNSAMLERIMSRGTRVTVEQSGSVTVDLKPMRWLE